MRQVFIPIEEEDRQMLIDALYALRRTLQDKAVPRPSRRGEYDPMAARTYHRAGLLAATIRTAI